MRKVQILAVFWTMLLAIPFTVIAISGLAFWTANLTDISTLIANFNQSLSVSGRGLLIEFSGRWPEVAGMIVGQLVIFIIFLVARNGKSAQINQSTKD
jgi:hypothetical protein